jgi:hypothetical protein
MTAPLPALATRDTLDARLERAVQAVRSAEEQRDRALHAAEVAADRLWDAIDAGHPPREIAVLRRLHDKAQARARAAIMAFVAAKDALDALAAPDPPDPEAA